MPCNKVVGTLEQSCGWVLCWKLVKQQCGNLGGTLWGNLRGCLATKLWEPWSNLLGTLGNLWGKVVETLWEPWSKAVGTLALGQPWSKAVGTFGPLWEPCGNLEAKWAKLWEASGNLAAKLWEPCANLGAKLWESWATVEQSCGNLGCFVGIL